MINMCVLWVISWSKIYIFECIASTILESYCIIGTYMHTYLWFVFVLVCGLHYFLPRIKRCTNHCLLHYLCNISAEKLFCNPDAYYILYIFITAWVGCFDCSGNSSANIRGKSTRCLYAVHHINIEFRLYWKVRVRTY